MKNLSILLLIATPMLLFAQTETINQLDEKGKKNGKWVEYLNAKFKVVKDSTKAVYWAYNYYADGENTYKISFGNEWRINHTLEHNNSNNQSGHKISILDGEYKWLDKKGRVVSIDSFKNGEHIWSKYYAWHVWDTWLGRPLGWRNKLVGKLHEFYDFTKHYDSQPNTYYIVEYETDGKEFQAYMRKGNYGWAAYQE